MTNEDYQGILAQESVELERDLRIANEIKVHVHKEFGIVLGWTYWGNIQYTRHQHSRSSQELFEEFRILRVAICKAHPPLNFEIKEIRAYSKKGVVVVYEAEDGRVDVTIELHVKADDLIFWTGKENCVVKEQQRNSYTVVCPVTK